MEYYSAIEKKTNCTICNNMDRARGYYAQWNKPGGERQVPNDFTHMWSIRTKENWRNKTAAESQNPRMDQYNIVYQLDCN